MKSTGTLKTFQIGLIMFFLFAGLFACKKTTKPTTCGHTTPAILDATCNLNFTRATSRMEHEVYPTGYIAVDTADSIKITFVAQTNTSVMVNGDVLVYNSDLSDDSTLYFEYSTTDDKSGEYVGEYMRYYFKKDSIVYTHFDYNRQSDLTAVYHTY